MQTQAHFKHRWLWTWDHSTNWVLDEPHLVDFGANNVYLKRAETFVEDYRRLIESAAEHNINGIIVWGLLRDAHGGVEAANEVCSIAKQNGIGIIAGVGTSEYGGFYYEGDHEFNSDTFGKRHPEAVVEGIALERLKLCPNHPDVVQWLRDGTQWLLETVGVAGLNLENGDFSACKCQRCVKARAEMSGDDPAYYKDMQAAMTPIIEQALETNPNVLLSYATYTGFVPGKDDSWRSQKYVRNPFMGTDCPLFARQTPEQVYAQWNIGGMMHTERLPLETFLDNGQPAGFESPYWPAGLKPPTRLNLGFLHQGSQWHKRMNSPEGTRYSQEIAAIKEGCMRSAESGLDGVIIHGEVTDRCVPMQLNYIAFDYFTRKPFASIRQFAEEALADRLGGASLAAQFIERLVAAEDQSISDNDSEELLATVSKHRKAVERVDAAQFDKWRRWRWLATETGAATAHSSSTSPHGIYF